MNQEDFRRKIAQSAELVSEAAFKQVQGMSEIMQTVLKENKDLHNELAGEQGHNARLQMECMDKDIEIRQLDDTICELITPRRLR